MIINGKQIAEEILSALEKERTGFGDLSLGVLVSAGDAAAQSYIKIKTRAAQRLGVRVEKIELSAEADEAEARYAIAEFAKNADGIVVQLPLPAGINLEAVLEALPEEKDIDALKQNRFLLPPVAEAIAEVLVRAGVAAANKKAVVVGAGRLVGLPAKKLLEDLGAKVEVIDKDRGSLEALKDADIVVLGTGEAGLIRPEMLKPGVVLIDAGTSDVAGALKGDADARCAGVASVFTPVPGGIGPIAVAMLFKNLFTLARSGQIG